MSLIPLVEHLVKGVVLEPEAVKVDEEEDRDAVTLFVQVSPNDVGKIIGKNGRVVSAIRYVVSASAAKVRQKAYVKIVTD